MGRLEIEIRHGHHGGGPAQWGAVVALIVLVLFAAAGHKETGAMLHEVLSIAAITALAVTVAAVLAVAGRIVVRARAARRARRPAAIPAPVHRDRAAPGDAARPALESPRRPVTWAWPGERDEITVRGGDRRRDS